MSTWEQRAWEAEQYERWETCPQCERPRIDPRVRGGCQCPVCELCGAVGDIVVIQDLGDDTAVCPACRLRLEAPRREA